MTPEDERLSVLAAALAPDRARILLARAPDTAAAEDGGRLAARPRRERVAALAATLAQPPRAPARVADVAARERHPVARLLREVSAGRVPEGAAPLLVRLCRERIGGG